MRAPVFLLLLKPGWLVAPAKTFRTFFVASLPPLSYVFIRVRMKGIARKRKSDKTAHWVGAHNERTDRD